MILLHGTTRRRAEQIIRTGPDAWFTEPGSQPAEGGFSTCLESGPFLFGTPDDYARGKAAAFPDEGGAVVLELDVPDDVVRKAVTDWFPLSQGLVQFDAGSGLEELLNFWPIIAQTATIRSLR